MAANGGWWMTNGGGWLARMVNDGCLVNGVWWLAGQWWGLWVAGQWLTSDGWLLMCLCGVSSQAAVLVMFVWFSYPTPPCWPHPC